MTPVIFSPDVHYIEFSIKYLTLCGLWNPYKDYRKWLYDIYTIFIVVFMYFTRIDAYFLAAQAFKQNFLQETLIMFLESAFVVGIFKIINILWHRADIEFIATTLTWERTLLCSKNVAVYRDQVVGETLRISKKITLIWLGLVVVDLVLFYRDNLIGNRRSIDDLPLGLTFLGRFLQKLNFFVILAIDYSTLVLSCAIIMSNDCLCLTLMLHIETQLKILNFRLRRCTTQTTSYFNPNQELIMCIQHYQKIFRMVRILQRVYGSLLLPQLLSSIILISVVGIHIFVTKSVDPTDPVSAGVVIMTLISGLTQLGIYCLGGNNILVESDRTSVMVYDSYWYMADTEFKKNMIIFLSMVENPLSIKAVGLFELSYVTFKSVSYITYN
ncbi:odorant receptor 94a [Fopius arisanus]|uniref:Odorant receptor n=1 Tax=Fopius arisanus TaxID=64838 RepID=A0A9R1TIW6_9HYME|nr:PREDICTED: odorant receptor 94a [Fopius arisanus]